VKGNDAPFIFNRQQIPVVADHSGPSRRSFVPVCPYGSHDFSTLRFHL
jgi:hypothetical protein